MLFRLILFPLLVNYAVALAGLTFDLGNLGSQRKSMTSPSKLVEQTSGSVLDSIPEEKSQSADFPVDVVYSWIPQPTEAEFNAILEDCPDLHQGWMRVRELDQLRFSLRLLEKNIPWVRTVFLVTNGNQGPDWLNTSSKVRVINQDDLVPIDRVTAVLPIHNSQQCEVYLHRIPDLAEHFIYFNDDMFVGRPLERSYFFTDAGKPIIYADALHADLGWRLRPEPGSTMGHHIAYPLSIPMIEEMQAMWPETFNRISSTHCRTSDPSQGPGWLYQWFGIMSGWADRHDGGKFAFLHDASKSAPKHAPSADTIVPSQEHAHKAAPGHKIAPSHENAIAYAIWKLRKLCSSMHLCSREDMMVDREDENNAEYHSREDASREDFKEEQEELRADMAFTNKARSWYTKQLSNPPEVACINDNFALNEKEFEKQMDDLDAFMKAFAGDRPSQFELNTYSNKSFVSVYRFYVEGKVEELPLLRRGLA